jgi:hypothetical protein
MRSGKLLAFAFFLLFTSGIYSQSQEVKNMRFGVGITPQLDWERSGNTNLYKGSGVAGKFGFGLNIEFRITDVVHFTTGIGGTFGGGSVNYGQADTIGYATDKSKNFIALSDINKDIIGTYTNPNNHFYKLNTRSYKTNYVTIPVALKMMTKAIGPLKYYILFGGNLEILTKARATDDVILNFGSSNASSTKLSDQDIYHDCIPVKASLNVGGGAEYTISGTTALVFGINYYRAFTSVTKSPSNYLFDGKPNNTGGMTPVTHKLFGDGFALSIGILF